MDAGIGGLLDGLPASVDVFLEGPGQTGDLRAANLPGHRLHRGKIPGGGEGKPGFDDVHVEEFQMPGNLQFLVDVEIGPGRLLPIPQGGIKNIDFLRHLTLLSQ